MIEIKQWAYGITVAAIIGAIVLALSPKGSTEKLVKTAVSLFLMCAILYPFISEANPTELFEKIELPEFDTSISQNDSARNFLANELKGKIAEILSQNGINDTDISIDISIENENEMKINSVQIFAAEEFKNQFEKAENALRSQLGIETKIEVKQ